MLADFSAIISGLSVDFTDISTGSPTIWSWDFGDPSSGINNTSNLQNPSHIFTENAKTYQISLYVSDGFLNDTIVKTITISYFQNDYEKLHQEKLTFESDDNRPASNTAIIEDVNGRKIAFYEKSLNSGRISNSRVTTPSGFTVTVEAGNGNINGIPVVWGSDSLLATPNTFQLVYVDSAGNPGITDDFDMTFTASVILLAYVFSGGSSITRIHEIEKDGRYIFTKRQKLNMGEWIWDNYEEILQSGQYPTVMYDSSLGRIHLNYTKDGAIYRRIIEVGNESEAWTYLLDYDIQVGNIITLNTDPTASTIGESSSTDGKISIREPITFAWTLMGFQYESLNPGHDWSNKYMFMPHVVVDSSVVNSLNVIVSNYHFYISDNETVVETINYDSNLHTWKNINTYNGTFYLGWSGEIRINGRTIPYELPKESRLRIYIENSATDISESPTMITDISHLSFRSQSSASDGLHNITATFEQIYEFHTDDTKADTDTLQSSSSNGLHNITATFEQMYEFHTDDTKTATDTLQSSASDARLI